MNEKNVKSDISLIVVCVLYVIVCLTWGTTWIGIKIALESLPPLTVSGLRFLVAFPFLLFITYIFKAPIFFPRKQTGFFIFLTLFYFSLPYYFIGYGEQYVSSGLTSLIFSTMPVFSMIFSYWLLKNKMKINQLIGVLIGFFCLVQILRSEGIIFSYSSLTGALAIFIAAMMHGFIYVYSKKYSSNINVFTFNTLPIGIAGIMLTALGFIIEKPEISQISSNSMLAILYLGVVASVGGFIAYFYLLKHMNPTALSLIFIIFPVVAIGIDTIYTGQPISSTLLVYSVVMLLGFLLTKIKFNRNNIKKKFSKG